MDNAAQKHIISQVMQKLTSSTQLFSSVKFEYLNEIQQFMNEDDFHSKFLPTFCKYQKIYWILTRFKLKYRYSKYKYQNGSDMYLNQIHEKSPTTVKIYQDNSIYLFSLRDLSNIILTSITNTCNIMIWQPTPIKNPYTNIPFKKSELYSIYFRMQKIAFKTHPIIQYFFECNFNIYEFCKKYEEIVKEYAIKKHIINASAEILVQDISYMLIAFAPNDASKLCNLPNEDLIKIMRPYLYSYYMACSFPDTNKELYYAQETRLNLSRFFSLYSNINLNSNKNNVCHSMENKKYFLNDHIYSEVQFNRYVHNSRFTYMNTDTPINLTESISGVEQNDELYESETIVSECNSDSDNSYYDRMYEEEDEGMYDP